jgi:glycosyltransferase involved in cell wall biosynthesis
MVSVVIPAYKVAPFISETLNSVFVQSFSDYEVIVVNDGSPDTVELEQQIRPCLSRITYLTQANSGAGAARNAGIRAANGEFIAFLDGDDIWLPSFLEEQLALISTTGSDLVYADAINVERGKLDRRTNMDINPSVGEVTAKALITAECMVITSSVLVRRELILQAGFFDESFRNSQDFDLWLRLAKAGARMAYQKKVLVRRRVYAGSLASNPINSLEGEIAVLKKTAGRMDLTAEERQSIQQTIALRTATVEIFRGKQRLTEGEFASALTSFRAANDYRPSWKLQLVMFWLQVAPHLLQRVYRLRAI